VLQYRRALFLFLLFPLAASPAPSSFPWCPEVTVPRPAWPKRLQAAAVVLLFVALAFKVQSRPLPSSFFLPPQLPSSSFPRAHAQHCHLSSSG
jgi:hypothetical protein